MFFINVLFLEKDLYVVVLKVDVYNVWMISLFQSKCDLRCLNFYIIILENFDIFIELGVWQLRNSVKVINFYFLLWDILVSEGFQLMENFV